MHPIFEKLYETLPGDVMAKAAPKRDIYAELMEGMESLAAEKKVTTDADAELMARLLNGGEK